MKNFNGNVLFLDRSDINTDEIIPARYLTEVEKPALKPHLLEDLCLDGFIQHRDINDKTAIVTRSNFGCGSSREHGPWALEANGIHMVIGESFARIFRQNMFNCGMMAVELPAEEIAKIFSLFAGTPAVVTTNLVKQCFDIRNDRTTGSFSFSISDFDKALLDAGGWVDYADARY